jgi:hypothetical protein
MRIGHRKEKKNAQKRCAWIAIYQTTKIALHYAIQK